MKKEIPELWCEHEFVVVVNRSSGNETHRVSMYGNGELIEDVVFDDVEARVVKNVSRQGEERTEVEFNSLGQITFSSKAEPGETGTTQITEISYGPMRSERTTVQTQLGQKIVLREKLFAKDVLQSDAETHYAEDGNPSLTVTNTFSAEGRIVNSEQIVWHSENNPAMSETTEYDWSGLAEYQTKTLHNTDGTVLWQERTKAPAHEPKPSKIDMFAIEDRPDRIPTPTPSAAQATAAATAPSISEQAMAHSGHALIGPPPRSPQRK